MSHYYFLPHHQFDQLITTLQSKGYRCKGPRVIENSIIFDDLAKASQLPWGYVDHQSPAKYSVKKTDAQRAFGWTLPVQSVKPMLFEEKEVLWAVTRNAEGKLSFEKKVDETDVEVRCESTASALLYALRNFKIWQIT